MTSFAFGDLFEYNGKEYIFLAETEEILYAARILNPEQSKLLNNRYEVVVKKNSPVEHNSAYSFVILQTKELKERAASFYQTGNERFDGFFYNPLNIALDHSDIKDILEEITKKKCISIKLKELVKDIEIK
jgi:hypothetical protein